MGKKKAVHVTPAENSDQSAPHDAEIAAGFEDSLAEVESVVERLESGELSLDESLRQYEKGVQSLRRCFEYLRKAERKIELLVGFDDSGRPLTEDFADGAVTLEEKQASRSARRGASQPSAAKPSKGPLYSQLDDNFGSFDDSDDSDDGGAYVDESPGLF